MPRSTYRWDGALWQPYGFTTGGAIPGSTPGTRDNLVPRYFFPDASTTGAISPREEMQTVSGNLSWGAEHDGQTITKQIFTGRLTLNTRNITFRDCIFEGALPNDTGSFCVWPNGLRCSGIKFIDCTFKPKFADHGTHIIMGHHFDALRCEFTGGVDGVSVVAPAGSGLRADVSLRGCWIHDLAYFSPDSFHTGDNQTHNDGVQWGSGVGFSVIGCRVEGFADPTIGDASAPSVDGTGGAHLSGNKLYPRLCVASGVLPVSAGVSKGYMPLGEFTCLGSWWSGGSVALNIYAGAVDGFFLTNDGTIVDDNWFGYDWQSGVNNVIYLRTDQQVTLGTNYRWGGVSKQNWLHGNVGTVPTPRAEDNPAVSGDPFDRSLVLPAAAYKRFA